MMNKEVNVILVYHLEKYWSEVVNVIWSSLWKGKIFFN